MSRILPVQSSEYTKFLSAAKSLFLSFLLDHERFIPPKYKTPFPNIKQPRLLFQVQTCPISVSFCWWESGCRSLQIELTKWKRSCVERLPIEESRSENHTDDVTQRLTQEEKWTIQGLHLREHLLWVSVTSPFVWQDRSQRLSKDSGGPYLLLLSK